MLTLSTDELRGLTGKRRSDAQARVLDALGIQYAARPDGSLVVLRAVVDLRLGGHHAATIQPREPELHL